jgi:DNA-directed RNA polymerase specialized sigma24 family protein
VTEHDRNADFGDGEGGGGTPRTTGAETDEQNAMALAAMTGDHDALNVFLAWLYADLRNFLGPKKRDLQPLKIETEDLVQGSVMRVWNGLAKGMWNPKKAGIRTWAHRAAEHHLIEKVRAASAQKRDFKNTASLETSRGADQTPIDPADTRSNAEFEAIDELAKGGARALLHQELLRWREDLRGPVNEVLLNGESIRATAARHKIDASKLRRTIGKVLDALRQNLGGMEQGPNEETK